MKGWPEQPAREEGKRGVRVRTAGASRGGVRRKEATGFGVSVVSPTRTHGNAKKGGRDAKGVKNVKLLIGLVREEKNGMQGKTWRKKRRRKRMVRSKRYQIR